MCAYSALTFRIAATLRAVLKLSAALAVALALGQAGPALAQHPQELPPFINLQHTLQVRKALQHDKDLAAFNLGVKVDNRVATLWGPVPSHSLANKAVKVARSVPDILEVRCLLYVDESQPAEPKFLPQAGAGWKLPTMAQTPASKDNAPESAKTTAATKTQSPWQAATTEKATSFKAMPVETPGQPDDQGLFVLPAIAVPFTSGGNEAGMELPLANNLKERVLKLKGTDWRYYYVHLAIEEGRVYVNGQVYQWGDLQQLTKAISQLPGVENVIIGQVGIKASK